jgi:hypothetical protein
MRPIQLAYWSGIASAIALWLGIDLRLGHLPLLLDVSLALMLAMAGLWGHVLLFGAQPAPEAAAPAQEIPVPPTAESASVALLPPESELRGIVLRAWHAAPEGDVQDRLAVRREFDPDFAAASAGLEDQAAHALLRCLPEGRARLGECAALLRLIQRHGPEVPTQPAVLRLHDTLAEISEKLGREFLRILAAAPDLDAAAVSRRLLERHLGAGQAVEEARLAAALLASIGAWLIAPAPRAPAEEVLPMAEPDAAARIPLPLLLQCSGLLAAETRPRLHQAMAAIFRAPPGPAMQAALEAYVASIGAPEHVALAALRGRAGIRAGLVRWEADRPRGRPRAA